MTWITDANRRKARKAGEITQKTKIQNQKLQILLFDQQCRQHIPTIERSLKYIKEEGGLDYCQIYPQGAFDPNQTQDISTNPYSIIWQVWIPNVSMPNLYLTFKNGQISFMCQIGKNTRKTTLKEINQASIVNISRQWFNFVY